MITPRNRIEVIDALRGFAIFCILIIHCSNNFLAGIESTKQITPFWQELNAATKSVLYFLLEGKAYGIFALLFGFTFGLQYYKAKSRNTDFGFRFLWRMVLLVGFGYLNAAFFAGGDPLVFMAIVAIILPVISRLNTKILIILATLFFLQPIEWYKILQISINPHYEMAAHTGGFYIANSKFVAEGNFLPMVWSNITVGLKAALAWAVEHGRACQTAGLYIIGFLCYKHDLFNKAGSKFWDKLVIITIVTTPLLYIAKALPTAAGDIEIPLQVAIDMWCNLSFLLLLIALFVILFRTNIFRRLTMPLQWYGKMSLTNFVFQSIIATFLFYPYGLNLVTHIGVFVSVLIGLGIATVQILFSHWWMKRHKHGPFEYLWNKGTYLW